MKNERLFYYGRRYLYSVSWPSRSYDLTLSDYFLRDFVKGGFYYNNRQSRDEIIRVNIVRLCGNVIGRFNKRVEE